MWKIGELARRTGLTVRTLHHYDQIGLLSPADRSEGGHRVYGDDDVRRLYRIVSLRSLGFPLDAIGAVLDRDGVDARAAVADHLHRLEDQIARDRELRRTLRSLLDRLETEDFLTTIEEMTMHQRYYSPEQLDQLEQRREALGGDAIRRAEHEWGEIFATLRAEMEAGTDPADPKLRPIAQRGRELLAMFTGGDAGIKQSLNEMWQNEDPAKLSHGMVDAEVMAYYGKVQAAAGGARSVVFRHGAHGAEDPGERVSEVLDVLRPRDQPVDVHRGELPGPLPLRRSLERAALHGLPAQGLRHGDRRRAVRRGGEDAGGLRGGQARRTPARALLLPDRAGLRRPRGLRQPALLRLARGGARRGAGVRPPRPALADARRKLAPVKDPLHGERR